MVSVSLCWKAAGQPNKSCFLEARYILSWGSADISWSRKSLCWGRKTDLQHRIRSLRMSLQLTLITAALISDYMLLIRFFQCLLSGKERMRDNVILIVLVCFTFSRILVFLVIGLKIKLYSFIFFAVAPFVAWSHISLKLLLFGLNFFRLLWSFKSTQGADSRRKHRWKGERCLSLILIRIRKQIACGQLTLPNNVHAKNGTRIEKRICEDY